MHHLHFLLLSLFSSLFLFSTIPLLAQGGGLLEEIQSSTAVFTTDEQSAWNKFQTDTSALSIKLLSVSTLSPALSGDSLEFEIPGDTNVYLARGTYFQKENDTTYSWWGQLANHGGYIGIASNPFGKLVYITTPNATYLIHPLSERYSVQIEIDMTTIPGDEPEMEAPEDITTNPDCSMDDCKATLAVLILYTPEAIDELLAPYSPGQQSNFGPLYWAVFPYTLNVALIESGIIGKSARFVKEEFELFEHDPSKIILNDLNRLTSNLDAWDRLIANKADILVLITDTRYGSYAGAASTQVPFAIVTVSNLHGRFTFAHEIGHLLEARHNRVSNSGDAPDGPDCNFGWRLTDPFTSQSRYTIMANTLGSDNARMLYFSNPNIELFPFSNTFLGTNSSFNAGRISQRFCAVASTFFDTEELSIDIDGPLSVCDEIVMYSIDIHAPGDGIPGNSPYSYRWFMGPLPYVSPLYGNSTFLGETSSITLDTENIPHDNFWIYASVSSSDGIFAVNDLIEVENPCSGFQKTTKETARVQEETARLVLVPNPSTGYLEFLLGESSEMVDYLILNSIGQYIDQGRALLDKGKSSLFFEAPSGVYTLSLRTSKAVISQKFIVQH